MASTDHAIVVGGIPLPSDTPLFLTMIAVHVVFGLVCAVAGLVAIVSFKRDGRHPTAGTVYYWSLAGVFVTATALSAVWWSENYHLFVLGSLSFAAVLLGRTAHRSRWNRWLPIHIAGMGTSYVLLMTAFYVDNGRNLPLWNQLPQAAFWILPSLIGIPLITRQLLRHPLMKQGPGMF